MEDIKAYIESGILELYVLGDISAEEKLQVEEMAKKHPVVKAELDEIERSMELYAADNAIEPSEHLRDKIMNSLVTNLADDRIFTSSHHTEEKDNVVPLIVPKQSSFYKFAFAACLALLIVSLVALMNVYNKLEDANTQLIALNTSNLKFSKTVNFMDEQLNVYRDPEFKMIKLQGTPKHKSVSMMVAFNATKKQVMIDMASVKMPETDKDHQYQLWALVNGKPVDLGVFDMNSADTSKMKEMKPVAIAQAFAVTLEPRGGSASPTMDQMMVIGQF